MIALAMIILALLTLIGISSTTTSTTEVQIASNNQNYQLEFYLADSGWRQGAMWVENRGAPPMWVNNGNNMVKNFGRNTAANANTGDLSALTPDNTTPGDAPTTFGHYRIPYWYQVEYLDPGAEGMTVDTASLAGNEKGFDRFYYEVTSNANERQQIEVRLSKIYKVGY
jgi:Tfp pilus assembly protein PilX